MRAHWYEAADSPAERQSLCELQASCTTASSIFVETLYFHTCSANMLGTLGAYCIAFCMVSRRAMLLAACARGVPGTFADRSSWPCRARISAGSWGFTPCQIIWEGARAQREPLAPFYSRHALAAYPARTISGHAEPVQSLALGGFTSQTIPKDRAWAQREPLAPFYSRHALAAYPARTPLAGLSAGYAELARSLPIGSGAMLLALRRLAARAGELLAGSGEEALGGTLDETPGKTLGTGQSGGSGGAGRFDSGYHGLRAGWRSGGSGGSGPGASGPAAPGGGARGDRAGAAPRQAQADAGLDLVRLLAQLLLIVDLQARTAVGEGRRAGRHWCIVLLLQLVCEAFAYGLTHPHVLAVGGRGPDVWGRAQESPSWGMLGL